MLKNVSVSLLLITIILMSGCRAPKDLIFKEYKNLSVETVGFTDAKLKVELVYYNPNNIGLELSRTDLDLYVDEVYLGHSTQNIQIAIPGRKNFTLPLLVNLDMKNLLKNGFNTLLNKEVLVRLAGNIKIGKAGVYKNIKIDYSSKQNFSMFK